MRAVYYTVLALVVLGLIALRLAQPIVLLQIGANVAGVVFMVASLHLLYVNCRLLRPAASADVAPGDSRVHVCFLWLLRGHVILEPVVKRARCEPWRPGKRT